MTSSVIGEPRIPSYREVMHAASAMDTDSGEPSPRFPSTPGPAPFYSPALTPTSDESPTASLVGAMRSSFFFSSSHLPLHGSSVSTSSSSACSSPVGVPSAPKRSRIAERPKDSVYQFVKQELQQNLPSDMANIILQYADRFAGAFATISVDTPVVSAAVAPSDSPSQFSIFTASEQADVKHRLCSNPFLPPKDPLPLSPSVTRGILFGTPPHNLSSLRVVAYVDRLSGSGKSVVAVGTACGAILVFHTESCVGDGAINTAIHPAYSLHASEFQINSISKLDGRTCASGGEDNVVRVWDLGAKKSIRSLVGHLRPVHSVSSVVERPSLVLSASVDCSLKLWDLRSGQCVQSLAGHSGPVNAATTLTVGGAGECCFVSASDDRFVKVWDPRTMKSHVTILAHSGPARVLTIGSMNRIISGGDDGAIKMWCASTGECLQTMRVHTEPITCLQSLPNGQLLSTSEDRTMRIWS